MSYKLTLADRAALYNAAFPFPGAPPLVATNRWLAGIWSVGNNYRGSGYYGAYPPTYLKRVLCMFPEVVPERILHLFSGSLSATTPGLRMDIRPDVGADIVGDAHNLSQQVSLGAFDLIMADPPYSKEDAAHYGTRMINRQKVVRECAAALAPTGHLIWLDTVLPMYRKDVILHVGIIGLVGSTNHRGRFVFIFKRCLDGTLCRTANTCGQPDSETGYGKCYKEGNECV